MLTEREMMVAERYAAGESHKEVAAKLHVAPSTVRNHLAAIYRKLDVSNKPELIRALSSRPQNKAALPPPESHAPSIPVLRNLDEIGAPARAGASIAVMPFADIGPTRADHFGHGVAADIHHDLTSCHDLLVSGRSSCLALSGHAADAVSVAKRLGVQYVVQGTVRSHRDKVRLTAELIDDATGAVLWSARFDRVLGDIFEVAAEVATAIVASLSLTIEDAQYERRRHMSADQFSAYDWGLQGNRCLELGGVANIEKARDCFARALALEPDSAAAHTGLSMSYGYECHQLLTMSYAESLERHRELAEQAVALDESDSRGHYALACALVLDGQYERADLHATRAMELSPSEYHNICNRGYTLMSLGRIAESVACFDESLRRNPLAPNSCLMALGLIEHLGANYGQSAVALSRMTAPYVQ
jgi:TolB-like protein/DNA-binding CsgD family transcriptional regulator